MDETVQFSSVARCPLFTRRRHTLQLIAEQRQQANRVKLETPIQVCIGNPPYKDKAQGMGGWIENGDAAEVPALLDDFRQEGNGRNEYVLKNLYVYFWRWAMWKVFESTPESTHGIVCFITATGYLNGPGFKGMREWIRRNTSRGWIINLTPEGKQPPANTAVFNIETEVAIALFVRDEANDHHDPATIKYIELHGTREEKFQDLSSLSLSHEAFEETSNSWTDGFFPRTSEQWTELPALDDLFPWKAPGVKPNKTWVYSPSADILDQRWNDLLREDDPIEKVRKFKETGDTALDKTKGPLPGPHTETATNAPLRNVAWPHEPSIVRVGYRSFDRQYILADSRLLHRPSPDLWAARTDDQVFIVEQHARFPGPGPGAHFSALLPDMNSFNNRGGRVLPKFHPDGTPNTAPQLLEELSRQFQIPVTADDLVAYVAGLSAHPPYVETFAEELHYDSNRIPITADAKIWHRAVHIGHQIIWLHTYGERGQPPHGAETVLDKFSGVGLPEYTRSVGTTMPETVTYDAETETLRLGNGVWENVDPRVWAYTVGGNPVIDSWVGYRRAKPKGRKSSPLDDITPTSWPTEWSRELHELLAVLTHLVQCEPQQAELLNQVRTSETLTKTELADRGVIWPQTDKNRKPRMPQTDTLL